MYYAVIRICMYIWYVVYEGYNLRIYACILRSTVILFLYALKLPLQAWQFCIMAYNSSNKLMKSTKMTKLCVIIFIHCPYFWVYFNWNYVSEYNVRAYVLSVIETDLTWSWTIQFSHLYMYIDATEECFINFSNEHRRVNYGDAEMFDKVVELIWSSFELETNFICFHSM